MKKAGVGSYLTYHLGALMVWTQSWQMWASIGAWGLGRDAVMQCWRCGVVEWSQIHAAECWKLSWELGGSKPRFDWSSGCLVPSKEDSSCTNLTFPTWAFWAPSLVATSRVSGNCSGIVALGWILESGDVSGAVRQIKPWQIVFKALNAKLSTQTYFWTEQSNVWINYGPIKKQNYYSFQSLKQPCCPTLSLWEEDSTGCSF